MASLPAFLKLLTSQQTLTMHQAMIAAQKLYPAYATIEQLKPMNHTDLKEAGITDDKVREGIISLCQKSSSPSRKKKRGRDSDLDAPLLSKRKPAQSAVVAQPTFDFEEIDHEEALTLKSCVVNRAPMMEAWATVVAERLGFNRREALSIAQVYTDMNANASGIARGIYPSSSRKQDANGNQPYVDLMGRRIPVLEMQDGEWRAISQSQVVEPTVAFSYLKRSFAQQLGAVIGALRLLAESFPVNELNEKGYGLYLEFRPDSEGWGKKAEVKLTTILDLRRYLTHRDDKKVKVEDDDIKPVVQSATVAELAADSTKTSPSKSLDDELEAALDEEIDLSALP